MRVYEWKDDLDEIVVEGIVAHAEARREAELGGNMTGGHDDDHGDGFARGNQIIEDGAGAAHGTPRVVGIAAAVEQVEDGEAGCTCS